MNRVWYNESDTFRKSVQMLFASDFHIFTLSETTSGYYKVYIHGKPTAVFCLMDTVAKTYLDLNTTTYAGNSIVTFWRVRLFLDQCLISIIGDDNTYSETSDIHTGGTFLKSFSSILIKMSLSRN